MIWTTSLRGAWFAACVLVGLGAPGRAAWGFAIYGATGLERGAHWDANLRFTSGVERSLSGGLRYSLSGGSFQAFRDRFNWSGGAPPLTDFEQAVRDAFNAWTVTDPATGLTSSLSFAPDFATPVADGHTLGAEIDVFATNLGGTGQRGETTLSWGSFRNVRLTSGVDYYAQPINGADIEINTGGTYSLSFFRLLLSHEIGHALGLRDVDIDAGPDGEYIDDNYDPSTAATAAQTLTNSFAARLDPFNPGGSPVRFFTVANGSPGLDSPNAHVLMESAIPSVLNGVLQPLKNDDYAGRQFLYPAAPVLPGVEQSLLLAGSTWRFLDNGSNQGTAWRDPAFDDGAWLQGPAQLGYGDGDEATLVNFGGNPNSRFVTTYFRTTFDFAADPDDVHYLLLDLLRDDGAAVYLNGVEIRRDTLVDGAAFNTLAFGTVGDVGETTFYRSLVDLSTLPPGTLRAGLNLLAVELHQSDLASSDVSFDLRLSALVVPEPSATLLAALGAILLTRRRRSTS